MYQIIHCVQLTLVFKRKQNKKALKLKAFIQSVRIFRTSGPGNNCFRLDLNLNLDLRPHTD